MFWKTELYGFTVNKKGVENYVRAGSREALIRTGGYIRKVARNSMKRATKSRPFSRPGEPPLVRRGNLKNAIFFAVEDGGKRNNPYVVVGPLKHRANNPPVLGTGARVLEMGGEVKVREIYRKNRETKEWGWERMRRKTIKANRKTRMNNIKIEARPYMGPALKAAKPYLARMFLAGSGPN